MSSLAGIGVADDDGDVVGLASPAPPPDLHTVRPGEIERPPNCTA
nr:hypothetical protein JVH1_3709 [Rhodococcus sp. JVH1]